MEELVNSSWWLVQVNPYAWDRYGFINYGYGAKTHQTTSKTLSCHSPYKTHFNAFILLFTFTFFPACFFHLSEASREKSWQAAQTTPEGLNKTSRLCSCGEKTPPGTVIVLWTREYKVVVHPRLTWNEMRRQNNPATRRSETRQAPCSALVYPCWNDRTQRRSQDRRKDTHSESCFIVRLTVCISIGRNSQWRIAWERNKGITRWVCRY